MARARKKPIEETPAAEAAPAPAEADMNVDTSALPAAEAPGAAVSVTATAPAIEPQQAEVNPFPRVIKTANFNGYKVRLMQDREANEMQIRFGEGARQDRPSDAVLDYVRSHLVPKQFHTVNEREKGQEVPWFRFSTEKGCWCAWMRNQPNITRTRAEEVFNGAVRIIAQELGQSPQEQAQGVPF